MAAFAYASMGGDPGANQDPLRHYDIGEVFKYISQGNVQVCDDIIRFLREKMLNERRVLEGPDSLWYLEVLSRLLLEGHETVCLQGLQLLEHSVPHFGDNLDRCMLYLMPSLVTVFGRDSVPVKEAAVRVLHVYMRYTNNWYHLMRAFILHGLEAENNAPVVRGCLDIVPVAFDAEFSNENLFLLVEALFRRLSDQTSGRDLVGATLTAIQKLSDTVGPQVFEFYFQRLDETLRTNYQRALNSRPVQPAGSNHDFSSVPSVNSGSSNSSNIQFGIFEASGLECLRQPEWRTRVEGVEHVKGRLQNREDLTPLVPHLEQFLQLLSRLLGDSCFKVVVLALNVYEILIARLKHKMTRYLRTLVGALAKHLGDLRVVVKEHNIKVIHKLMCETHPKVILDILLEQRANRNPRIREEVLNRVTAAILTFPSYNFEFSSLCSWVAPSLVDNKRRVRLAALECMAVLAQAIGPARMAPLVAAVDQVEVNSDGDGLLTAVQARLARKILPRCTVDGMVMYAMGIPNSAGGGRSSNRMTGADVDWVLAASGSTGSLTPPASKSNSVAQQQQQQQAPQQQPELVKPEDIPNEFAFDPVLASVVSGIDTEKVEEKVVLEDIEDHEERTKASTPFPVRPILVGHNSLTRRRQSSRSAPPISTTPHKTKSVRHREVLIRAARSLEDVQTKCQSTDGLGTEPTTSKIEGFVRLPLDDVPIAPPVEDESTDSPDGDSEWKSKDDIEEFVPNQEEDEDSPLRSKSVTSPVMTSEEVTPLPVSETTRGSSQLSHSLLVETRTADEQPAESPPPLRKSLSETAMLQMGGKATPPVEPEMAGSREQLDVQMEPQTFLRRGKGHLTRSMVKPSSRQIPVAVHRMSSVSLPSSSMSNPPPAPSNAPKQTSTNSSASENIRSALRLMANEEWNIKTDGMELLKSVSASHPMAIVPQLHAVVGALVAEIKNLRSSVSRCAIHTTELLFTTLKKNMEPELDTVVGALLHKSGENTGFIREDVDRALGQLIEHVTPHKALVALLIRGGSHRNDFVRKTCAQFSSCAVSVMGPAKCLGSKEIAEKLLPLTTNFVMDRIPLTRYYGRLIFLELMGHPDFLKKAQRFVTQSKLKNIRLILDSIQKKGVGEMPNSSQSRK